jgi:hypothetical protein
VNKNKDFLKIAVLLFFSIVAMYFIPASKMIFLLFTLVLFFNSNPKHDYFWVFFVFVITYSPGNLFQQMTDKIITIGPIILSFLQMFIIVAAVKIMLKKEKYKGIRIFFAKSSYPYLFWLVFLLIEGLVIGVEGGGTTGYRYYYYYFLTFVIFPVFFVMPYLIKDYSDVVNLYKLIAVFVIFNFAAQLVNLVIGMSFHTLFGGNIVSGFDDSNVLDKGNGLLRPDYFIDGMLFAFIMSAFFLYVEQHSINRPFLYISFYISLFSIFITAARGWIIAFALYIIFLVFINGFTSKKMVIQKMIVGLIIMSFIVISTVPIVKQQFFKSFERLETVNAILKGDVTAGGTNARLTDRLYPVLEKFKERPILGWGFSKTGMETHDGHVGFLSPLMIGGVIGGSIILLFILAIVHKYNRLFRYLQPKHPLKRGLIILISSFIILLVINFTSAQVFGFYRYVADRGPGALRVAMYLSILNAVYYSAIKENKNHI